MCRNAIVSLLAAALSATPAHSQPIKLPEPSEIRLIPAEKVEAALYSAKEALKWSAQVVFAPPEAAKTKLLYVYDPRDCRAFDWKGLSGEWGDSRVSLGFIRPGEAANFTVGAVPLWTVSSKSGDRRPADLLASEGSSLCNAAQKEDYWIVLDAPLPNLDYKMKLIAKMPP